MAASYISGSTALQYQLHGAILGGFQTNGNDAFATLPVSGVAGAGGTPGAADLAAGRALRSEFSGANDSIIMALNAAFAAGGDLSAGFGIDSVKLASQQVALTASVAGPGLGFSSGVMSVGVDDSSIEISGDALQVKSEGITNGMLAGSIANAKLVNDSVTVTAGDALTGGGEVDLGSSITLNVAVDDSSIEVSGDALQVKSEGITNGMLAGSIANAKLVNDSVTVTAGDALTGGGEVDLGSSITLNVAVDDSSIEVSGDALQVKSEGITNGMLAGSIANAKLVNDSVTVTAGDALTGGGEVDLGSSITLNVAVDDSSIEVSGDALQVKSEGITNGMLAGSIANAKLVNDSVTVTAGDALTGGGEVDLGSSITLNVAVDDSSIEVSGDALQVKSEGIENAMLNADVFSSDHTFTGVQKFDTEVLRIAGTNTDSGTKKAFSLRVEGGILILEDKGNF